MTFRKYVFTRLLSVVVYVPCSSVGQLWLFLIISPSCYVIDCSVAICDPEHCGGKPVWTARSGSNSSDATGVLPAVVAIPGCPCCWYTLWGCSPASTSTCELSPYMSCSYNEASSV